MEVIVAGADSIFHWYTHQLPLLIPRGLLLLPANASQSPGFWIEHNLERFGVSPFLPLVKLLYIQTCTDTGEGGGVKQPEQLADKATAAFGLCITF